MKGRDLVTAGLYGLLFASVVVVLVARHPAGDEPRSQWRLDGASVGAETLERAEGLPEMRRVVQYMFVR
jgi:hypothetical protein